MDVGTLTGQIRIEDQLSSNLTMIASKVQKFAENFDGAFGAIGIGASAAVAAIGGMSAAIIALGNRGADINDVSSTFEHFSRSSDAAKANLEALRDGTLGTVQDFDLMKNASKLLAADVKLNADQFGTLSKAAFMLQNQGLGPTKDMLDLVSQAMLTGRTRTLEMRIGKLDLVTAEREYARSLGKSRDELTPTQQIEAKRIGILDALNKKLAETGEVQRDFGEQMEFAVTQIKNWGDELAAQVAASPAVMGAVQAIGDAIAENFGGTGQKAIDVIVKGIEWFANKVREYGPIIIHWAAETVKWVTQIRDWILHMWDAVQKAWDDIPDWFKEIAKNAAIASVAVAGVNSGMVALTGADLLANIASFATIWSGFGKGITAVLRPLGELVAMTAAFGAAGFGTTIAEWGTSLATFAMSGVGLTIAAIIALGGAIYLLVNHWDTVKKVAGDVWDWVVDKTKWAFEIVSKAIDYFTSSTLGQLFINLTEIQVKIAGWTFITLGKWAFELLTKGIELAWKGLKILYNYFVAPELESFWADVKGLASTIGDGLVWAFEKAARVFHTLFDPLLAAVKWLNEHLPSPVGGNPTTPQPPKLPAPVPSHAPGMPLWEGPIQPESTTASGPPKPDEDAIRKEEEYNKKVRDLAKSLREGSEEVKVFASAFGSLKGEAKNNYELLQALVPKIEQYAEAHAGKLAPGMKETLDNALNSRLAFLSMGDAILSAKGATLDIIESEKRLGKSQQDIATQYDVTSEQLQHYLTYLQKQRSLQESNAALAEKEANAGAINRGIKLAWEAEEQFHDMVDKRTLTSTDYQIKQIQRLAQQQLDAYDGDKDNFEAYKRYILLQSDEKVQALLRDDDALLSNSKEALRQIAQRTRATYEAMAADPERYTKETIRHFKKIAEEAENAAEGTQSAWSKAYKALDDVDKILAAIPGTFAEITSMAVRAGKAIMENLAEGDWIGALIAGSTAIVGIFGKIFGLIREGRNEVVKFVNSFDTLKPGTGAQELREELTRLGDAGERLWVNLTQGVPAGNKEAAERAIRAVQEALAKLDADIQKYNLTWLDLVDAQKAASNAGKDLVSTYKELRDAGYKVEVVTERMSGDLNQYVIDAVDAGVKIPAAMKPIIESLIKQGKLSQEAAAAILGLRDKSAPSLDEIREAAGRYGITLDSLGPKVKQLEINELAAQYVDDWKTLTSVTGDWGVLFDKMGPKVQSLVLDAIKYGAELPANMQPMIEAFINAGQLVDENGNKLTDLTKLHFAKDLTEMFDELIKKLDELIDKIGDGVGGALDSIGRRETHTKVIVDYEDSGVPQQNRAGGGLIYAAGGWRENGSDTVRAMLTPGERVLTVAENREYEQGQEQVTNVYLDGDIITKVVMRRMPGMMRAYGVA